MNRSFTKVLFLLSILIALAVTHAFGQTITIGSVDPGPYAPGSTIAVPVHINYGGNCIPTTNTFRLFFSDATGVYPGTATATFTGSYITFMNFKIPAGTPAGTGYKVKITSSTNTTATIVASSAFTIIGGTGVTAGISAPNLNGNVGVFGNCNGTANYEFDFQDSSDPHKSSVTFFNEKTQTIQQTTPVAATGSFIAGLTNYTVIVKGISTDGIVGTMAYPLINNPASNGFAVANSGAACLTTGVANVPFNIPTGNIQDNYPGNIYTIDWGDGSPKSVYTFCDIQASLGNVSHDYKTTSCGQPNNQFPVTCQLSNAYCASLVTAVGSSAKVINVPTNKFPIPLPACTNTAVSFINNSDPGSDPGQANCVNTNANYTWSVIDKNGVTVFKQLNLKLNQPFVYTFTTAGTYTIQLELQSSASSCGAIPVSHQICVQDSPVPSFNFTNTTVCTADNPIVPINTSVVPATGCTVAQYQWSVTPSAGVSFNASSATPQFTFSNPGVYQVGLTITTASCGPVLAQSQTLTVNSSPVVQLSPDYKSCGNNQTLSFNNSDPSSPTYTVLAGTAAVQPDTYTWTVSGGTYSFAPGFNQNSKYPNIIFNDYAAYTVTVTQKNNCNSVTKTQNITFQQAPTIDAGIYPSICATGTIALNGQVKPDMSQIVSLKWTGGTGTYTPNANSLTATYKPSAAEISAGKVTLILEATTSIAAPCNTIDSRTTITITPTDVINSSLAPPPICSNTKLNYKITSPDPAATFTWTAKVQSGSASGYSTTGSGALINDQLVNTDVTATTNAVIDYTITPTNTNGCPGTPADVIVTVAPLPLIKATGPTAPICSSNAAGINITSSVSGTKYTWTSNATGPVTGNTSNPTATDLPNGVQDILINNGSAPVTVTYTFTPVSPTTCTGGTTQATVIVNPAPVVANAGSDFRVCDLTTVQLKGNSPSPGTGLWTVTPSTGVTFTDATSPTTGVSGLLPGNVYKFTWTITYFGCSTSNSINVSVFAPTLGGTTSTTDQPIVCAGNNRGTIVLSGQLGDIQNWQSSTDNGVTWAPVTPVNTTQSLSYLNLTQTTTYEAIIKNGSCNIGYSTPITITVNQPAVTAYAGPPQNKCNITTYTMQANDPGTFPAKWTQLTGPTVNITDPTKYNTTITGLQGGNVYSFQWTIQAVTPCSSSSDQVVITDAADVTPSFTADKTVFCGEQNVTFTNTSNDPTGTASYLWDFGDGSPTSSDVNPQHVFTEDPSGKDALYTVTLTVLKNCAAHAPAQQIITVRPAVPDAELLPDKITGCGPTTFTVQNFSKGDNDTYDFYVKDAQGNPVYQSGPKTDKSSVTFNLSSNVEANYTLYMTATNLCGNVNTSPIITISMSPADIGAVISSADAKTQCFPFTTTLSNASGGTSYYYQVTGPDGQLPPIPAVSGDQPYPFPKPGNYIIQLFASDACSPKVPSNILNYTIVAQPEPAFTASIDCSNMATFVNNTPDPGGLLSYNWDYGDGTSGPNPFHQYTYDGKHNNYQITLTATSTSTKCFNTVSQNVTIGPLLTAAFGVLPGNSISLPDYHFNFVDQSTGGPTTWLWDFGDGQTSTQQNPGHTYAYGNVGDHLVTLTVTRPTCPPSTTQQTVAITGVPGQLYLPNAFIPDGSVQALRIFMAKGAGIKTWLLQIFNNYGQLMWQTTKLDGNGSPVEGWDGTFKGSPAPQGAYTWQASATFINGSEWKGMSYQNSLPKRTGTVNLIR